jgi:hypothetical protein
MLLMSLLAAFPILSPDPQHQPQPPAAVAVPVHVVDSGGHSGGRSPLMVVGTLFTGGHCYREDDGNRVHATPAGQIVMPARFAANKYSHVATEYALGNVRPRPGTDQEETLVFLTSPALENGHEFTIDRVSRIGNAWTVEASHWHDDHKPQWSPGPTRDVHLLRLGWLSAGDYTCRVVLSRRFVMTDAPRQGIYATTAMLTGEAAFSVSKGDPWHAHPWDQPLSTATVREESLTAMKFEAPPEKNGLADQPVYYGFKKLPAASEGMKDKPSVEVGVTPALDWRKHSQSDATLWEAFLTPDKTPADGVLVARITGGKAHALPRFDWAEVSGIEWSNESAPDADRVVTIYATVWRRPYIDGNAPTATSPRPAFAVPIETRGLGPVADLAKTLRVRVVWSEGIDNPRNAVSEVRR